MLILLFWQGIRLNLNGVIDVGLPKRVLKNVDFKSRQENRQVFRQPVSTSGILKLIRPPTHNQGVVGSCPTGPTLRIKHLQSRAVDVLFFTPGRCQDLCEIGGFVLKKWDRSSFIFKQIGNPLLLYSIRLKYPLLFYTKTKYLP